MIELPSPCLEGTWPVERALAARRSERNLEDDPLDLSQAGQLLWAGQGRSGRFRTCPSAGATYPLAVYLVAARVANLAPGIYRYDPDAHGLEPMSTGDPRSELAAAGLGQPWLLSSPAVILIAATYERTTRQYGEKGIRYVHMEAGHAAQNIYLQTVALGLGTVAVGAFEEDLVRSALSLDDSQVPLYLMPVGRTA